MLSKPVSFTLIWADHGSGGTYDVSVFRMNPAPGYRCLGHVAIARYGPPDSNLYRLVIQTSRMILSLIFLKFLYFFKGCTRYLAGQITGYLAGRTKNCLTNNVNFK